MKRLFIISAFILTAAWQSLSQNSVDALRYSRIDIGGTARYMGLSGAFGALGADFTASSMNPAGIGLYKSSEITLTPSVHIGSAESSYNGTIGNDMRSNFFMGNAGIVLSSDVKSDPKKPGWRSISFATGVNRLNDFNYRYDMQGFNPSNSLLDTYTESAEGIPFKDIEDDAYGDYAFDLNLAWWAWLLDLKNPLVDGSYISPIQQGAGKYQWKQVDSRGSMNEYVFTLGANYNDRLYLGMTFGIPMIRYYETSYYEESDIQNSNLKYFKRIEDLETHGSGFNMKLGAIYRASDWLRIGAAFHTPSWFGNMTDYWNATMIAEYYDPPDPWDSTRQTYFAEFSPSGTYDYSLNTPYRIQGSLGFIIGNVGAIDLDYEFADYANARFDAPDYSFNAENTDISKKYTSGHTLRVGTEWRYNIFSFRAGGKYLTSPFADNINDGSRWGISGGLGLRLKWFFLDVTYAFTKSEEDYYFYKTDYISPNPVLNSTRSHYILTTLGVKL